MKKTFIFYAIILILLGCQNNSSKSEENKQDSTISNLNISVNSKTDSLNIKLKDSLSVKFNYWKINETDLKNYIIHDQPIQEFSINPNKDTIIICKKGTKIFIPEKSIKLINSYAPIKGNVKIQVQEYYTLTDFILNRLTTTSNNDILRSGGMLKVEITYNNEPVEISSPLTYFFPKQKNEKNMEMFIGKKLNNGKINWIKEEIKEKSIRISYRDNHYVTENSFKIYNQSKSSLEKNKINRIDLSCYIYNNLIWTNKDLKDFSKTWVEVRFYKNTKTFKVYGLNKDFDDRLTEIIKNMPSDIFAKAFPPHDETYVLYIYNEYHNEYTRKFTPVFSEYEKIAKTNGISMKELFSEKYKNLLVEADIKYNVLKTVKTGWLNCDDFINIKERTDFAYIPQSNSEIVFLLYKNELIAIEGTLIDKTLNFKQIPILPNAYLCGIRIFKSQPFFAIEPINFKDEVVFDYKEMALSDVEKKINELK